MFAVDGPTPGHSEYEKPVLALEVPGRPTQIDLGRQLHSTISLPLLHPSFNTHAPRTQIDLVRQLHSTISLPLLHPSLNTRLGQRFVTPCLHTMNM